MKVLKWLKRRKIYYNRNTIVTINGLRIAPNEITSEEFNSREDGILCEKWDKGILIAYYNKAWARICKLINC